MYSQPFFLHKKVVFIKKWGTFVVQFKKNSY